MLNISKKLMNVSSKTARCLTNAPALLAEAVFQEIAVVFSPQWLGF